MNDSDKIWRGFLETGKKPFKVKDVDFYRDGGTMKVLFTSDVQSSVYVNHRYQTIHSGIPCTDDNKITDDVWIAFFRLQLKYYVRKLIDKAERTAKLLP